MKRVLTAAVLIPLVVGLIFWGSNRSVRLALAFLALLCLSEFLRLASRYGAQPMRLPAYLSGAWIVAAEPIVSIAGAYGPLPALLLDPGPAFFLFFALLLLVLAMLGGRELSASLPGAAATLLGVIYTAVPFRMAADLHALSPHWIFYVLIVNWVGDSAAYYAGRALGRRRLAPRRPRLWERCICGASCLPAPGGWRLCSCRSSSTSLPRWAISPSPRSSAAPMSKTAAACCPVTAAFSTAWTACCFRCRSCGWRPVDEPTSRRAVRQAALQNRRRGRRLRRIW